jgi:hypothetical protein
MAVCVCVFFLAVRMRNAKNAVKYIRMDRDTIQYTTCKHTKDTHQRNAREIDDSSLYTIRLALDRRNNSNDWNGMSALGAMLRQ